MTEVIQFKVGHFYKRTYNYRDRQLSNTITFKVMSLGKRFIDAKIVQTDEYYTNAPYRSDINYEFLYSKTIEVDESEVVAELL